MKNPSDPTLREDLLKHVSNELGDARPAHEQELDKKLQLALSRERRSRRALLSMLAVAVVLWLVAVAIQLSQPVTLPEPLLFTFVAALLLAPVTALIFAGLYFFKYRPRRKRVETKTDRAVLEEMRREIDGLKRRLEQYERGAK